MILFDEHTFQLGLKPTTSRDLEDDFSFSKQVIFRFQPFSFRSVFVSKRHVLICVPGQHVSSLKSEKIDPQTLKMDIDKT